MLLAWLGLSEATRAQRRTLVAAALGWMLDAFDVMLYALVVAYIMSDLHMTKATAGLLNTLTLLASGIGGILFGFLADRLGRTRALSLSILTYSVCSFACGFSHSVLQLAFFRCLLGLGMGGEWNTGATLVAETWPSHLRARALALVQSSWAIGYAMAALVAGVVLRFANWRYVFFIGVLPALVVLWIRRSVPESELWRATKKPIVAPQSASAASSRLSSGTSDSPLKRFTGWDLLRPPLLRNTVLILLLNVFGLFGWWGLFTWIPPYLSLPVASGGRGFGVLSTTGLLVTLNLCGMFPGYLLFGAVADKLGRKAAFTLYLLSAALLIPLYANARSPWLIMVMGIVVAFFATGFFSGSGLIASEMFPTEVRARGLGVTYNGARMLSAAAPFVIGAVGQRHGLNTAFYLCAAAFLLAAISVLPLPETRGRQLQ